MAAAPAVGGGLVRVLACGSVDDGKSTLIGRLLYDAGAVPEDHLRTLAADSVRVGTRGGELDYALLLDGLAAEREQGITIDVAWRQFATPRRRFVIADAPGHEQYTRNMATGAAAADVAVLLVDARKGLLTQTLRHSRIAALFGVREVVLAVNKMDLVGLSQDVFDGIAQGYRAFAAGLGLGRVTAIPIAAADGDNVVARSARMPWYTGPTLLGRVETLEPADASSEAASACRCSGSTVRTPTSAATRGVWCAVASVRAMPCACCPAAVRRGSDASSPWTATSPRRSPAGRSRW